MLLTSAFERVTVISLEFKADRRALLRRQLQEAGLAGGGDLEWTRAVLGDLCVPPAWWGSGNGAWGCLKSHVRILEDALMDGMESVLILEDDAEPHVHAEWMLDAVMADLPADWGQLYLGGQHLQDLHRPPKALPGTCLMQPHNVNRTHAFAVHKRSMAAVLQHIQHAPDYVLEAEIENGRMKEWKAKGWHIDHQLGRAHERKDWPVYCPQWWLFAQGEGASNISGRTNPRKFWHWRGHAEKLPFVVVDSRFQIQDSRVPEGLHFGNNLEPGGWTDKGLLENGMDRDFLMTIAQEALEFGSLPGICIPAGMGDGPLRAWPGGSVRYGEHEGLLNYPG